MSDDSIDSTMLLSCSCESYASSAKTELMTEIIKITLHKKIVSTSLKRKQMLAE